MAEIKINTLASAEEQSIREKASELFRNCPIPDAELIASAGLFVKRQDLTKQLFFNELYQKVLNVHGSIFEFGVRWGPNLVTLNNLRGIYEPYNHNRKIVGFDTFSGFPVIDEKDGAHDIVKRGAFSVSENYEAYLQQLLDYHEGECALNHISKNRLVKGDATIELERYLKKNPHTIIAFAWFDFDIYEPTKRCLELIKPHITKGTIIGFDELNDAQFPGETLALAEVLGLKEIRLERNRFSGMQSYFIVD